MQKIKNVSPKKAYEQLNNDEDIVLIDVRTYAENKFVGRVEGSVLIPWIDEPDWEINPQFCDLVDNLTQIQKYQKQTQIILICRSGNRSFDAGMALFKRGYTNIFNIASGFEGDLDEDNQRGNLNGWRHDGLPWEQC